MHKTSESPLLERIRSSSTPRTPQPADVAPRTAPLPYIRAVLFDIHGTLLLSDPPGAGLAAAADPLAAVASALSAAGWSDVQLPDDFDPVARLAQEREAALAAKRQEGIDHPEVDLAALWREPLGQLTKTPAKKLGAAAVERFVVELECLVNPPWPMPGLTETLSALRAGGRKLGLLANSQFFTPLMFEAVVGQSIQQAGFEPCCRILSHEIGAAKPSLRLFEEAVIALENELAILSDEVLYLGSDMRQGIRPAAGVGFRTALFAGDAGSLNLYDEALDTQGPPDRVLTDLRQLPSVLAPIKAKSKLTGLDLEADLGGDD